MQKRKRSRPYWLLIVAILSVSTSSILIRFALTDADPIVIAMYRMALSAFFTAILLAVALKKKPVRFYPGMAGLIFLAGCLLAVHFAVWISSLKYLNVSSSVVLVTTTPIWVALASPILLKEKPGPKIAIGLCIAILGGLIIALGARCQFIGLQFRCGTAEGVNPHQTLGYFLALVGAWAAAGYMLIGRKLSQKIETLPYTLGVYSVACAVLLIFAVVQKLPLTGFSNKTWFALLGLGLIPQILGHTVLNFSLRKFSALTVSMALLGEPIGSTLLASLFLREMPSAFELAGGIVILTGVVLVVWFQSHSNAVSPTGQLTLPDDV
ncbi:MAG: DMT family transporter [Anaerolineaceae bacterium]|nr:DMT family transporter [Anaerolineaceae bacterium]